MLAVLVPSVRSVAVTVCEPMVERVTLTVLVPADNAPLDGSVAAASLSLEVIPTMSVALMIKFQLASTALTVTLKDALAVCAVGVPVLPVVVPGAAISPGTRICNLAKAPGLTMMGGLTLAVLVPSVM